jgi:hypothetical protein
MALRGLPGVLVVLVPLLWSAPAFAQYGVWRADSLLAAGRLDDAETAYYAATRARPRDPIARAALGRFLAARGAPRVGAVLIEEARRFGGDSARLAGALVPIYSRAADYASLVALRPDVLTDAERKRVRYLRDNAPQARLRDSIAMITYRPTADGEGFGTIVLRVGRAELPAKLDPRVSGLVLPASSRRDVRDFGPDGNRRLGVVRSLRIGGTVFSNVPAVIGHPDEAVRIGFDVLAPYAPSFDPVAGLMTLRRVDRRSPVPPGARLPALFDANGMRVLLNGAWYQSSASPIAMLLATRAWMFDTRRGDIVLR